MAEKNQSIAQVFAKRFILLIMRFKFSLVFIVSFCQQDPDLALLYIQEFQSGEVLSINTEKNS